MAFKPLSGNPFENTYLVGDFAVSPKPMLSTTTENKEWVAAPCKKGEGYSLYKDQINTIQYVNLDNIKTQKAKGLALLYRGSFASFGPGVGNPGYHDITYLLPHNCLRINEPFQEGMFARPCPVTPRHGFVDSRPVSSFQEAINLFNNEVLPADPNGELILMPKFTGAISAVATSSGVVWGKGHDGVTGEGSGVVKIPTYGVSNSNWNNIVRDMTRVYPKDAGINHSAYFELVEHTGKMVLVQMRDGPEQPATVDYIPEKVKVKVILRPRDVGCNLLKWEKHLKAMKKEFPEGGLVIELVGSSLSSHFAVHGIELGIPVITSRFVRHDGILEPIALETKRLTKADLKKVRSNLLKWLDRDYINTEGSREQKSAIATAVATVHAMSQWGNEGLLLDLRSQAVVTLARAFMSASLGELRHWGTNGPGRLGYDRETPVKKIGFNGHSRSYIYARGMGPHSLRQMLKLYVPMYRDFMHMKWGRVEDTGETGYGGPNWAAVTMAGLKLTKALQRFVQTPTPLKWSEVILAANVAVHTAHNGGLALNKWLNQNDFHRISVTPGIGFSNIHAGMFALGMAPDAIAFKKKHKKSPYKSRRHNRNDR